MVDPWLNHPAGKDVVERSSAVLGWDVAATARDSGGAASGRRSCSWPSSSATWPRTAVLSAEGVRCDMAAGPLAGRVRGAGRRRRGGARARARGAGRARRGDGQGVPREPRRDDGADRRVARGRRGDLRGGRPGRRPGGGQREQREADGPLRVGHARSSARRSSRAAAARRPIRLSVAGAFHSPLMEPALAPVREVLSRDRVPRAVVPDRPQRERDADHAAAARCATACRVTWCRRCGGKPRCAPWRTPASRGSSRPDPETCLLSLRGGRCPGPWCAPSAHPTRPGRSPTRFGGSRMTSDIGVRRRRPRSGRRRPKRSCVPSRR